jgi:hypothetical protein
MEVSIAVVIALALGVIIVASRKSKRPFIENYLKSFTRLSDAIHKREMLALASLPAGDGQAEILSVASMMKNWQRGNSAIELAEAWNNSVDADARKELIDAFSQKHSPSLSQDAKKLSLKPRGEFVCRTSKREKAPNDQQLFVFVMEEAMPQANAEVGKFTEASGMDSLSETFQTHLAWIIVQAKLMERFQITKREIDIFSGRMDALMNASR